VSAPALALGQGYVPGYASQHPGLRAGPRCCEDRHPRGGNCRLIRESHSRTPSLAHRGRRRARRLRSPTVPAAALRRSRSSPRCVSGRPPGAWPPCSTTRRPGSDALSQLRWDL